MKFAYSNIAWTPHDSPDVFALLRNHGITGIEVAPTKVWPDWNGATAEAARAYRERLAEAGFAVPAMQAILFGKPELHVFQPATRPAFLEHLKLVAKIGEGLGAKVAVFGAPKQRTRGSLSHEEAIASCVPLFREAGNIFADHGVSLCIEPNPRRYGCDFITHAREGAALVRAVDHPAFGLHLDAAGMYLEGDSLGDVWSDAAPLLRHFHVSEPDLGDFRAAVVPHANNLELLQRESFPGWCSVEMRETAVPLTESGPWRYIQQSIGAH